MLQCTHTLDGSLEAGIDEAGRGCLWGPLYAAAVIWPPEDEMTEDQRSIAPRIKDSKKIPAKRRDLLAEQIQAFATAYGIGSVSAAEIDALGMTKANQLAFTRALEALPAEPDRLIIDGCLSIYAAPWSMKEQIVEPEADGRYLPVAAASILAKTAHDAWVTEWCDANANLAEKYDLLSCKGYGTAKHRAGVLQWGETPEHRKLFLRKLFAGKETAGDSALES
jgi:ribonuclease HII